MATTSRDRYTHEDLEQLPEGRYEIVGGELLVSPSPNVLHQTIVLRLGAQLVGFASKFGGSAWVAPLDVKFSETDVAQPDVIFVSADRMEIVRDNYLDGAPSFLIEVLSPSSYDTDPGLKLELYARFGVPEYWIVDPRTHTIVAHAEPRDGGYLRHRTAHSGCMASLTIPELTLSVL